MTVQKKLKPYENLHNSSIHQLWTSGFKCTILFIALSVIPASAQENSTQSLEGEKSSEYRIEKPGTITFTVGVKIKGKVEKPQVMIFLPKEKPVYKDNTLSRSFSKEINTPLPFTPMVE